MTLLPKDQCKNISFGDVSVQMSHKANIIIIRTVHNLKTVQILKYSLRA